MSLLPLSLVSFGMLLSFMGFKVGAVLWAAAPVLVYILLSAVKFPELRMWSLVGLLCAAVAVLSFLVRVGA